MRKSCPVCKSKNQTILYRCNFNQEPIKSYLISFYSNNIDLKYLENSEFVVSECMDCSLVFQKDVLNDSGLKLLYEKWIDSEVANEEHAGNRDKRFYLNRAKQIINIINFIGKNPNEIKVLDYGCGWGYWGQIAVALGLDVYGFDLSKDRLLAAKKKGLKILTTKDLNKHSFDYINTEAVFEHLINPRNDLDDLVKLLNNQGIVRVYVPNGSKIKDNLLHNDWSLSKSNARSLNPIAPLEHVNCFNRNSLERLGQEVGLAPVKVGFENQVFFGSDFRPSSLYYKLSNYFKNDSTDVLFIKGRVAK